MTQQLIIQVFLVDSTGITTQSMWTGNSLGMTPEKLHEVVEGLGRMTQERFIETLQKAQDELETRPVAQGYAGAADLTIHPETGTCAPPPGKNKGLN